MPNSRQTQRIDVQYMQCLPQNPLYRLCVSSTVSLTDADNTRCRTVHLEQLARSLDPKHTQP